MGFLAKIGLWLIKNPAIVMTGIVTAMFIMVVVSKNAEIRSLDNAINNPKNGWIARNAALSQDNSALKLNNTGLTASLATQSQSIKDLATQGHLNDAKFDTLIAGMGQANATTARKLDAINKAQPGADRCASALSLIRSSVQ
jgi:hypothetical protein